MNDGLATAAFQKDWLARSTELMQKYRPQLMYFDNGVNSRAYDGVKLEHTARFYNHEAGLGEDATIVSKDRAYLAGSVNTFEKATRAPKWIYPGPWLSDNTIGDNSWGYIDGMKYRTAQDILTELVELTCKGGGLLLNVSPMGDGSIPAEQQAILRQVGAWMRANGAALNGSRPWLVYGEGPWVPAAPPADWRGGSTADPDNYLPQRELPTPTEADFQFTVKADSLFVIGLRPAAGAATAAIRSLASGCVQVERVLLVASSRPLKFRQTANALIVDLPPGLGDLPYVLAVQGKQSLSA
jgi:alpha-L-fucosidase